MGLHLKIFQQQVFLAFKDKTQRQKSCSCISLIFTGKAMLKCSFSSRNWPANAGNECKQFTENTSVALQEPILMHAHTKCPPVQHCGNFPKATATEMNHNLVCTFIEVSTAYRFCYIPILTGLGWKEKKWCCE